MIKEAIINLSKKKDLTSQEAEQVMHDIMTGTASHVQMSAYITALNLKGETIEEITGSAAGLRKHCIRLLHDEDALEIVGTGGDNSNSFNISTAAAIVTAAAGVKVAKHGNRSASSKCGSADVLEQLGVNIKIPPEKSAHLLKTIHICFLYAQNYHIAMKYIAPVRKELGTRTIFNILGPLVNPAGASMQLLGVYDENLVEPLAQVLSNLGVKNSMVVYGMDGLDEISLCAETKVCQIKNGTLNNYVIKPENFGFKRCKKEDLVGGTPKENAQILKNILQGEKGHKRNAVVLNSASALYIANKCDSIQAGINLSEEILDQGKALEKLNEFIIMSNQ